MQYRIDPKSGRELSALGFGCMRFPRGLGGKIDVDKTEALIRTAIAQGVNYFDTAYIYGGSEEALGEVLQRIGGRETICLATKLPFGQCKSGADFERLFQIQLARLKTDYIDYYLIHNISEPALWRRLCSWGIEGWIAEKKASGQIRQIGFSFHGAQDGFFGLLDAYDWDFCQIQYNYMNINYQAGQAGLKRAHEKGLAVVIMEPLLGGRLATGLPKRAAQLFHAAAADLTPAAWALRWLWNQPEVTVILSGMNAPQQLAENLQTAETAVVGCLTEREAAAFPPVIAAFEQAYEIPCTGCNYCLPCPQKVNIPAAFAAYNARRAMGLVTGMMQYFTSTGVMNPGKNYSPKNCVKCGKCEQKCPQKIEIIKSLETVSRRMEPWWARTAIKVILRPKKPR